MAEDSNDNQKKPIEAAPVPKQQPLTRIQGNDGVALNFHYSKKPTAAPPEKPKKK